MSIVLPAQNRQFIREDDRLFYISTVINERIDVGVIAQQFISACEQAFAAARVLRDAGAAGVGKAQSLSGLIAATDTFSDEATANAFLAAFQAALDA